MDLIIKSNILVIEVEHFPDSESEESLTNKIIWFNNVLVWLWHRM